MHHEVVEEGLDDLEQLLVRVVNGAIVNDHLGSLDDFLDVFEGARPVGPGLPALVLCVDVGVDLLRVDVVYTHGGAIFAHDLGLEAKLAMAHTPHEVGLALACCLFLLYARVCLFLNSFRVHDLRGSEVFENVVLDL